MNQKVIGFIDKPDRTPVVEPAPDDLSKKVVEELVDLVGKVEQQQQAKDRSRTGYLSYRVPFAGVRYYSYE